MNLKYKQYDKNDRFNESDADKYLKMRNEEVDYNWRSTLARQSKLNQMNVKCKYCGHTMFPVKDRTLCTHCGRWIYKNDKIEFAYKLKEISKKY